MKNRSNNDLSVHAMLQSQLQVDPNQFYSLMLEQQPQFVVRELIKSGLKLTPDNIKKFLVFSAFGIHRIDFIKNIQLQSDYKERIIRVNGSSIDTNDAFEYLFKEVDLSLTGVSEELLKKCRYGCSKIFKYAHDKHLETGKKRQGANFYFIHVIRAWELLDSKLINISQNKTELIRNTIFLHDVVEEMQSYREKQFSNLLLTKMSSKVHSVPNSDVTNLISSKIISKQEQKLTTEIMSDETLKTLYEEILNPPEYQEIMELMNTPLIAKQVVSFVWAVTKQAESIDASLNRLVDVSKKMFIEHNENYDVPVLVKLGDSLDNTSTLPESGASAQLNRFKKNLYFLKALDENLIIPHKIQNENIIRLRQDLIECSTESIKRLFDKYAIEKDCNRKTYTNVEKRDYAVILKKLTFYNNQFKILNKRKF
ncbi:hypothetical protein HN587_04090 [Candidatus Woesearchaeota archaeon]|nr:hypothetical protein [Candidatus Woesearchaeota archaeon]